MQTARLTTANLSGAVLDRMVGRDALANNADFSRVSMQQTNLNGAHLGRSVFDGATINYAGFV